MIRYICIILALFNFFVITQSGFLLADKGYPTTRNLFLMQAFIPIAHKVSPSVVELYEGGRRLGFALAIDDEGHLLSALHIVPKQSVSVISTTGERGLAILLGVDERDDIALLKMKDTLHLPIPTFCDFSKLKVGQWVVSVGTSKRPLAVGVISVLSREVFVNRQIEPVLNLLNRYLGEQRNSPDPTPRSEPRDFYKVIQHDSPLALEHIGSPIANSKGEIVGINVSNVLRGTSYSVSIHRILEVLPLLKKGETIHEPPKGFLGINVGEVPDFLQDKYKIDSGAIVLEAHKGYPAEKANIKKEDIIISVNGKKIMGMDHLVVVIQDTPPGSTVNLEVLREGKLYNFSVILDKIPNTH